jgi:hypothetical protein
MAGAGDANLPAPPSRSIPPAAEVLARTDDSHLDYVVVPETPQPHGTAGHAQTLPDLFLFGVIGTLGSDDVVDFYRLRVDRGAPVFEFELIANPSSPGPVQLVLFSSTGQLLGQWTSSDRAGAQYIDVQTALLPPGSDVFLGIASTAPPGSSSPYQLWVTRDTPALPSSAIEAPVQASQPLALVAGPVSPTSTPPSPAGAGVSLPNLPGAGLARLAVGSLPAQTARPVGGVMAGEEPLEPESTPAAHLPALATESVLATAMESDSVHTRPTPSGRVLFPLRGARGGPLLGAAAIGGWNGPTENRPEEVAGVGGELEVPQAPPRPCSAEATAQALPEKAPRPRVSVAISSGLGLAIAVTLNAVFSIPAAGFDSLASRLDHDGRRRGGGGRRKPAE